MALVRGDLRVFGSGHVEGSSAAAKGTRVGRATDIELVIRSIHEMLAAKERLTSPEKLSERLVESGWRRDRAVAAIERAVEQDDRLHIGRGRSLVYSGRDTAIYGRIGTLLHLWTPSSGWRVDDVIDCHARKDLRGFGDWQYPDLLVLADPRPGGGC